MALMPKEVAEKFFDHIDFAKITTEIDWQKMFPAMQLGERRDPKAAARKIAADVDKLKSCSEVGKLAIRQERCARAGFTIDGTPCFYFDRTRVT